VNAVLGRMGYSPGPGTIKNGLSESRRFQSTTENSETPKYCSFIPQTPVTIAQSIKVYPRKCHAQTTLKGTIETAILEYIPVINDVSLN
jgi:hypothetical protein